MLVKIINIKIIIIGTEKFILPIGLSIQSAQIQIQNCSLVYIFSMMIAISITTP